MPDDKATIDGVTSASEPKKNDDPGSKAWPIPGRADFGGSQFAQVDEIKINRAHYDPVHNIPLKKGDVLLFSGNGLARYSKLDFKESFDGPPLFTSLKASDSADNFISFKVPDLDGKVGKEGFLFLELISLNNSFNRVLSPYAVYHGQSAEDQEQGGKDQGGEKGPGTDGSSKKGALGAGMFVDAAGDILRNAAKMTGLGVGGGGATQASSAGAKTVSKSSVKRGEAGIGGESDNGEISEPATEEVSSFGGEVISEDGTASVGGQVVSRGETSVSGGQTVTSGETVTESRAAKVSLSGTTETAGKASVSGTVSGGQEALSGTASINAQVDGLAGATLAEQSQSPQAGQANISGKAETEIKGGITAPAQAGESLSAQEKTTVKARASIPSLGQASGQAAGTTIQGGTAQFGGGFNISGGTAGTTSAAIGKASGSVGIKAEQPAAVKQAPTKTDQNKTGQTGESKIETADVNLAEAESASYNPTVQNETRPLNAVNIGTSEAPTEDKGSGGVGQKKTNVEQNAGIGVVPPQYQAMIDALGKKSQIKGAVEGIESRNRPPEKDNVPEIAPSRKIGNVPGEPVAKSKESKAEPGGQGGPGLPKPDQEKTPDDLQKSLGRPSEKEGIPEIPSPLNSGDLAQHPGQAGDLQGLSENPEEEENPEELSGSPAVQSVRPRKQPTELISQTKRILEKSRAKGKVVGKSTSKIWYYGFSSASGTLFSGVDFFAGAIVMDLYWLLGHRKDKELFPLKGWQKIVTIAAHIIPLIYLSAFLVGMAYIGCNYPNVKFSTLTMAGYGNICETINNAASNISSGLGGLAPVQNLPAPSGSCSPVLAGPASIANLQTTCFGANAPYASAIANGESGGDVFSESRSDKCTDGRSVSIGLFQINISAHDLPGLPCTKAFNHMFTASQSCTIVNEALYSQCVQAAKTAAVNISAACQISGNGQKWSAWGANKKCGF